MKPYLLITSAVMLAVLVSACGNGAEDSAAGTPVPTVVTENVIIAEGRIEPTRFVDIAFHASGNVSDVLVVEGEQVKAGQVIASLENSGVKRAELANAVEAFLLAEQAFDSAHATALMDLADAHAAARKAQIDMDNFAIPSDLRKMTTSEALSYTAANLEQARIDFEPYKYQEERLERELKNDKPDKPKVYRSTALQTKKRLDDKWAEYNKAIKWATLESTLESARSQIEAADKEYEKLSSGSDSDETAKAEALYEAAQSHLAAAEAALADVELRAPFKGTIAGLNIKPGESIIPGEIAVSVADFSEWIVITTDLTELDVVEISDGQTVLIKLDAIPDMEIEGLVIEIGQNYTEKQGDIVYKVTVELIDTLPNMRWGMTVTVKFTGE